MPSAKLIHLFLALTIAACASSSNSNRVKIEEMYQGYKTKHFADVADSSASNAMKIIESEQVIILDVREDNERAVSIIPGAIDLVAFSNMKPDTSKKIIVYCTVGYRSGLKCLELKKKGYEALNLKGGILAWVDAGHMVHNDGTETKRIHVYGATWDIVPEDYESIY